MNVPFLDLDAQYLSIKEYIDKAIADAIKDSGYIKSPSCPASMPVIMELAKKHDLKVIEDSAQAQGAEINDDTIVRIAETLKKCSVL